MHIRYLRFGQMAVWNGDREFSGSFFRFLNDVLFQELVLSSDIVAPQKIGVKIDIDVYRCLCKKMSGIQRIRYLRQLEHGIAQIFLRRNLKFFGIFFEIFGMTVPLCYWRRINQILAAVFIGFLFANLALAWGWRGKKLFPPSRDALPPGTYSLEQFHPDRPIKLLLESVIPHIVRFRSCTWHRNQARINVTVSAAERSALFGKLDVQGFSPELSCVPEQGDLLQCTVFVQWH